jgi:hypothetical protein
MGVEIDRLLRSVLALLGVPYPVLRFQNSP